MTSVLTFDRLVPGKSFGALTEVVDGQLLGQWQGLYPGLLNGNGVVPAGIATVLMMRAFLKMVVPRPPGNIHAGQQFTLVTPVETGEAVQTELSCISKTLRGERRFVEFSVRATGREQRLLFTGILNLIWAA